ncbi:MAG TPA: MFS transporter, partial [Micrococcaceae bacterium]|nr:MFS transporter [Micrococcaceae bacterium]
LLVPQLALLWTVTGGLGCGSTIVLALSLFSLRTRNHSQAAALSGMAQSVGYLLAAAGPVAFGWLHDLTGSWSIPLGLTAAVMVVMSVFAMLASRNRFLA